MVSLWLEGLLFGQVVIVFASAHRKKTIASEERWFGSKVGVGGTFDRLLLCPACSLPARVAEARPPPFWQGRSRLLAAAPIALRDAEGEA